MRFYPGSYPCYLTQAITRRLLIGCIKTHTHGRQVTSTCKIASKRIQGLLEAYFGTKNSGEQEKNPLSV